MTINYSPNSNIARPAATRTTCRPSTLNEIGGDLVFPPSERRQTSPPVSASNAKTNPPAAPNTNPPSVESSPLIGACCCVPVGALLESVLERARYSHFLAPVAASSARTLRVDGSIWLEPLPTKNPFSPRVTLLGGSLVKTELLSVAGMKIDCRL
jgi:hypothetical protein